MASATQSFSIPWDLLDKKENRAISEMLAAYGNTAKGMREVQNYMNSQGITGRAMARQSGGGAGSVGGGAVGNGTTTINPQQFGPGDIQSKGYLTTTPATATALDQLVSTLAGGGTQTQQATQNARLQEIDRNRTRQGEYSKASAVTDAQSLVTKAINDALTAAAPRITAYAEGAGTSKSSTAALLTQKAATTGAVEGAALGANLSTAYGQIGNQLAGVLELLTRQDPNSPTALLASTISGSRGIVQPDTTNADKSKAELDLIQAQIDKLKAPATLAAPQGSSASTPTSYNSGSYGSLFPSNTQQTPSSGSGYIIANPTNPAQIVSPGAIDQEDADMGAAMQGASDWSVFDQEDADLGSLFAA